MYTSAVDDPSDQPEEKDNQEHQGDGRPAEEPETAHCYHLLSSYFSLSMFLPMAGFLLLIAETRVDVFTF